MRRKRTKREVSIGKLEPKKANEGAIAKVRGEGKKAQGGGGVARHKPQKPKPPNIYRTKKNWLFCHSQEKGGRNVSRNKRKSVGAHESSGGSE